ncbi:NADP-dependent alcohol dehydrogenase [Planctomycetales bacterium]|nr:NADP-dependent alcohol dehydrogenase [Planctomycetales bacterium]
MKKRTALYLLTLLFIAAGYTNAQDNRIPSKGMAVKDATYVFTPFEFTRHPVGDNDILIDILYAGICHSDIHTARQEWGKITFPMVPGHEIAGRVAKIGKNVTKFKVGDYAGVGCLVNACGKCEACEEDTEQHCKGAVWTYNSKDPFHDHEWTQGGYSKNIVVAENFAVKIPASADIKRVAPLLCAGVTTYSPIRYAGVKKGDKVGIAGFGGLGQVALQYAVKLGAEVTVFDITEDKRQDALRFGAVRYVNVTKPDELKGLENEFSFIMSTIPANYEAAVYMRMLKINGQLCIIGLPSITDMPNIPLDNFVWTSRRKVFGSLIGGIKETQEVLDYSVANNIYPQVEIIQPDQITEAYQKVLDGKVRYRYVIDMSKL